MAELISAKDLPVSEAENVKLLCVDGAELKLKSADGLGGGGYVLTAPADAFSSDDDGAYITITEDCGPIAELMSKGASVWLDLSQTEAATMMGASWIMVPMSFVAFVGNQLIMGVGFEGFNIQVICPNCSWTPGNK